ncbi:hypothetical protein DFH28DRAFT_1139054 [Melampsora americana]|nr:hypothetical protein DFH28DRAFT_1139054 [Melampsora americana]
MSDYLTLESHPAWSQFQSLHKDFKKFLDPDLEYRDATRDELRAVMAHFGIAAQYRRSNLKKEPLFKNYKTQLIPVIQPFLIKKPSNQIAIDTENVVKLDLAASDTTKGDILAEVKKHVPTMRTTSMMDRTELITLYRSSVLLEKSDTGETPANPRFMDKPLKWSHKELLRKRRDDIRSALQFLRPDIFIPTKFLSLDVCTRVYEKFVLNMAVESDVIVHGVHYYCRKL